LLLNIKNVSFSYESLRALENVSFEAREGEMLGVIGPNGSGKTTLLRCINQTLKPKTGTVLIDGQELSRLDRTEIAKKIGVVPQRFTTFPFTVFDVVLMGRFPHIDALSGESPHDFDIVKNAMAMTGTLHLCERAIDELSGGELQRVIIARALAQEPEVLLLDEPTLHLDVNHQLEVLELVKRITKEKGLITVLVSHDLNLAARYCDRLLLLSAGRVHSVGEVREVLTPEKIREVFHVEVDVIYNERTQSYNVILVSPVG
jgi:iron complex transport system ATP-binding protein